MKKKTDFWKDRWALSDVFVYVSYVYSELHVHFVSCLFCTTNLFCHVCFLLVFFFFFFFWSLVHSVYRLAGLVVKVSVSRATDPGFDFRLRRDVSELSHTSDLKIATPVATLPGAWRYKVSAGTGCTGVSIL